MRKVSKILFLVGGILAAFTMLVLLGLAVAFLYFGVIATLVAKDPSGIDQSLINGLDYFAKYIARTKGAYEILAGDFIGKGIGFTVSFLFSIPAVILSFTCRSREKPSLGLLIVTTIICALGSCFVSVAGGVTGIINWALNDRNEAQ